MEVINITLFYMFFCSAILIYGIGILPVVEMSLSRKPLFLSAAKSFSCVIATVTLTFLIKKHLLFPLRLNDLYPLVALLIFVSLGVFFEIIVQLTAKKSIGEFSFPYLAILLSVNEGDTLVHAIVISFVVLASYYLLIPILQAFSNRTGLLKNTDSFKQKLSLFLCIVIFMLALYSLNISWLNITLGD